MAQDKAGSEIWSWYMVRIWRRRGLCTMGCSLYHSAWRSEPNLNSADINAIIGRGGFYPIVDLHFARYTLWVKYRRNEPDRLPSELKHLVAELFSLKISDPDSIADDAPLFGGSLGLDSLDALELAICIEEEFGLTLSNREESQRAFSSISSLTHFILTQTQQNSIPQLSTSPAKMNSQVLASSSIA